MKYKERIVYHLPSSNSNLDNILKKLYLCEQKGVKVSPATFVAKQRIKDLVLGIIGDDEPQTITVEAHASNNGVVPEQVRTDGWAVNRNKLRAELRRKVESL